jgi:hypothetical protein
MGGSRPSPVERQAETMRAQNQAQMQGMTNTAQGTLSQFEGPVKDSPFYKSLLNTGLESTSAAYDRATSTARSRAKGAGFGYAQPVEQGAEAEIGARGAGALAKVPGEALLQASGPALQAAGTTGNIGTTVGGQGISALNTEAGLYNERQARQSAMWQALAKAGTGVIGSFTGGGG